MMGLLMEGLGISVLDIGNLTITFIIGFLYKLNLKTVKNITLN